MATMTLQEALAICCSYSDRSMFADAVAAQRYRDAREMVRGSAVMTLYRGPDSNDRAPELPTP